MEFDKWPESKKIFKSLSKTFSRGACCNYALKLAAFCSSDKWGSAHKDAVYILPKTISKNQADASRALGNFSLSAKVSVTLGANLYVQVRDHSMPKQFSYANSPL